MSTKPLKTLAFWISLISALAGLLVAQGVVLHGSTVDVIAGYLVTILGIFGGHSVAGAPADQTAATSPANPPPAA